MDASLLANLNAARQKREAVAVVTDLATGDQRLVPGKDMADDPLAEELLGRAKSGKSGVISGHSGETFIQIHVPPPRLVIIGAVHISQALYPIAQACDFDVTIVDPRTAFATPERFENVTLCADWPKDVFENVKLDAFTALAAVTHDPKIDDHPLQAALESNCFYVGALGSRKTHSKRLDRLKQEGLADETLARIQAPIGLDIGASSPAEIAVAVMAQVIEALRKGRAM